MGPLWVGDPLLHLVRAPRPSVTDNEGQQDRNFCITLFKPCGNANVELDVIPDVDLTV